MYPGHNRSGGRCSSCGTMPSNSSPCGATSPCGVNIRTTPPPVKPCAGNCADILVQDAETGDWIYKGCDEDHVIVKNVEYVRENVTVDEKKATLADAPLSGYLFNVYRNGVLVGESCYERTSTSIDFQEEFSETPGGLAEECIVVEYYKEGEYNQGGEDGC